MDAAPGLPLTSAGFAHRNGMKVRLQGPVSPKSLIAVDLEARHDCVLDGLKPLLLLRYFPRQNMVLGSKWAAALHSLAKMVPQRDIIKTTTPG